MFKTEITLRKVFKGKETLEFSVNKFHQRLNKDLINKLIDKTIDLSNLTTPTIIKPSNIESCLNYYLNLETLTPNCFYILQSNTINLD